MINEYSVLAWEVREAHETGGSHLLGAFEHLADAKTFQLAVMQRRDCPCPATNFIIIAPRLKFG